METRMAFEQTWAEAVAKYEKITERKLQGDSVFSKLRTVDDLRKEVENEKDRFDLFREERHKAFSALAKCLKPVERLINVAQSALGSSPFMAASIVLGAAGFLLTACSEVSQAYDGLEELFQRLGDVTVRLQEYVSHDMEASLRAKMVDILVCLLEIMGQCEVLVRRRRFKQWARMVFLSDTDIRDSIDRLNNYIASEFGLVIALTYGRMGELEKAMLEEKQVLGNVAAGMDTIIAGQNSDRKARIGEAEEERLSRALETKAALTVATRHAEHVERLVEGTGRWVVEEPMFQAWEQEQAPILWVFGKPGSGKTFLSACTIEYLKNKYPQNTEHASLTSVSYFYVKEDDPDLRDMNQIFKTIAAQIAKANPRYQRFAAGVCKDLDKLVTATQTWENLFLNFFSGDSAAGFAKSLAYIVIDGLDEAPERERTRLIACLKRLVTHSSLKTRCRIQIAIFARPEVRGDPGFEDICFQRQEKIIHVTADRNQADIKTYIRQRLEEIAVLRKLKSVATQKGIKKYRNVTKKIDESIRTRAKGMFLWAKLVFDQIYALPSPEAILRALEDAPPKLDEMIHHVFKRLEISDNTGLNYINELLKWVTCAYRPLLLAELYIILLITIDQHCYVLDDDLGGKFSTLFDLFGPPRDTAETGSEPDVEEDGSEAFSFLDAADEDEENEGDGDIVSDMDGGDDDEDDKDDEDDEDDEDDDGDDDNDEKEETSSLNQDDYPRYYSTTVGFSHARIRDYLVREGTSKRRWRDCQVGIDDLNLANLQIGLTCLRILCSDITEKYNAAGLRVYAAQNFVKHLAQVDLSTVSQGDKRAVARQLYLLFHDGSRILQSSCNDIEVFVQTWFATKEFVDVVCAILHDGITEFTAEEGSWVQEALSSQKELFRPMALSCVRKWLTKSGWDDPAYLDKSQFEVKILYAYFTAIKEVEGVTPSSLVGLGWAPLSVVTEEQLKRLAEFGSIDQSPHWHAGLAWILMECEYTDAAIYHFQKALDESPDGWMAMEGLARCYGNYRSDLRPAIEWMRKAVDNLPRTAVYEGIEFYLYPWISDWKRNLGDIDGAIAAAKTAYDIGKTDFVYDECNDCLLRSVVYYISALYEVRRFSDVIQLIYEMDGIETAFPTSLLVQFLLKGDEDYDFAVFDKIGFIAQSSGNTEFLEFVLARLDKALDILEDDDDKEPFIGLAIRTATLRSRYGSHPEKSITLLETAVTTIDQSSESIQARQSRNRSTATDALGEIYFSAAVAALKQGHDPEAHISALRKLAKHVQGGLSFYRTSYPAMTLGIWLREYEKADDATWRACFRPALKEALYMLSDDDPWNDRAAYAQLGATLLLAGDRLNASISLGMTTGLLEEESEREDQSELEADKDDQDEMLSEGVYVEHPGDGMEADRQIQSDVKAEEREEQRNEGEESERQAESSRSEAADDETSQEAAWSWACDGICTGEPYAELHFCEICNDTCFCGNCLAVVKADRMPFRKCHPDHSFVQIFPMTSEAKEMASSLIGGVSEKQQKWLGGIKETWGVSFE